MYVLFHDQGQRKYSQPLASGWGPLTSAGTSCERTNDYPRSRGWWECGAQNFYCLPFYGNPVHIIHFYHLT